MGMRPSRIRLPVDHSSKGFTIQISLAKPALRNGQPRQRTVYTVQGFSGSGWGTGIPGILSIIFGLILVANPLVAATTLVLLLAGLAIIGGIAAIIFTSRLPG